MQFKFMIQNETIIAIVWTLFDEQTATIYREQRSASITPRACLDRLLIGRVLERGVAWKGSERIERIGE